MSEKVKKEHENILRLLYGISVRQAHLNIVALLPTNKFSILYWYWFA